MAQTTPATTPQQKSTQPPPPPPPIQKPQTSEQGWIYFDGSVGTDIGLNDAQLQEMQKLDDSYRSRYDGLSKDPSDSGLKDLTLDRENKIKGMLTPTQYDQWTNKYGTGRHATGTPDGGMRTTPKK